MDDLFFDQNGYVRSGWRFAIFLIAFLFLIFLVSPVVFLILKNTSVGSVGLFASIINSLMGLVFAIFLGWICGKYLEYLPFRALGTWFTKFWLKDFILGLLIGAISVAFAVSVAMAFGGLRFQFNQMAGISAIQVSLVVSLIIFIFGAASEEVLIRGYIFQTFVRSDLAWLAILITSVFFGLMHISNPNAELFSTVNTALAGVWLGVAYLKTRTLWLAFGLHLSWNWMQGSIFGIEVSGLTSITAAPLLTEIDRGPTWLTGANYGIEGGIVCTIALIVSTALIWYLPWLKPTEEMLALTSERIPIADKLPQEN